MIDIRGSYIVLVTTSALMFAQGTAAQTPPDAGALRQEIEKETKIPEPKTKKQTLLGVPQQVKKAAPAGLSVRVKSFRFEGNSVLSDEQLGAAVASYLERPLTFPELESVLTQVTEAYKNAGWIARSFLPPQDIESGSVEVRVVEAKFGEARINGPKPERVEGNRLLATVSKSLKQGELLSATALEVALRRVNELPGVAVTAVLAAGKNVGETDVLINLKDGPQFRGTVSLDNHGSRFTGEERVIGSLVFDSPFRRGEQITTTLLHSAGTDYGQLMGTLPLGYSGLRVGAQASILNYDIVEGFGGLDAQGESTSLGLTASYPLVLERKRHLSLSTALTNTSFANEAAGTLTKYSVSAMNATLMGYSFDELGGGGVNQASFSLSAGDAKPDAGDSLKGEGSFVKARYSLSRQQRVASRFTFYGALSGQIAGDTLSSSEKFAQGGASGLRAFTSSEGSGDEGHMLNLELRIPLPQNFDVTAFYDIGRIRVEKDPELDPDEVPPVNEYTLQGAGLAGAWYAKSGFTVKASWAKVIGSNKLTEGSGSEEDDDQFWLQVSKSF